MTSRWLPFPRRNSRNNSTLSKPNRTRGLRLDKLEERLTPANQLLPDLHVLPANLATWYVQDAGNGTKEIRFGTGMANGGAGPFELNGTGTYITDGDGIQRQLVNQKVYFDDGTSISRPAGYFVYHPAHGHTHFDDFAWGQLRIRPADQSIGAIVAIGPKTSFCLLDSAHYDPSLPGSPSSGVYSCSVTKQGISVGWNDLYYASLDGQSINLAGVPNGDYWLEVVADPNNHILEQNENNNTTRVAITINSLPAANFRIQTITPVGASYTPANYVEIAFSQSVDPATLTTGDVSVTGPSGNIPVTSISKVDATHFRANFATQSVLGTYSATVGPDIANTSGQRLDQNNNGVTLEAGDSTTDIFTITAPRILGASPTGAISPPISSVRITYSQQMDVTTFNKADIYSFTGPGGVDLLSTITSVTPVSAGATSTDFDVSFTSVSAPGAYSMVVEPNLANPAGYTVDQNGDNITNASDRYTISVTLQPLGVSGPDAFGYSGVTTPLQNLEIAGTPGATSITFTNTDDGTTAINLGTNKFNLYGQTYTGANVFVNTNGLITFGQGSTAYSNGDLSGLTVNSTTIYPPTIAALWDDWLKGSGTPQALYRIDDTNSDGTADRLIVEWNQVFHYSTSPSGVTFQAVLQLNTGATPGSVLFNYPDLVSGDGNANGVSASVGIRANGQGATKLLISQDGSNSLVSNGKAIKLSVPTVTSIVRLEPNPAEAGDVHYEITFSDAVTGFEGTDLKLSTTGVNGAFIEHIDTTPDPRVFHVHCGTGFGNGTLRLDLIDDGTIMSSLGAQLGGTGAGNGSFTTGDSYTIVQPAPEILGSTVADGTAQRSIVNQMLVIFDYPVQFTGNATDAFVVTGKYGPVAITVDLTQSNPQQTIAKLTFSGTGTQNGSLMDSLYTMQILASHVSTGGMQLDGDNDGTPGGNYVMTFHRLFGDVNGDRKVDATDFGQLRAAFNTVSTDPSYNASFDFDGDGKIDANDFSAFRTRFNSVI